MIYGGTEDINNTSNYLYTNKCVSEKSNNYMLQ